MQPNTVTALERGEDSFLPDVPDAADVRLLAQVLDDGPERATAVAAEVLRSSGGAAGLLWTSRSQLVAAGLTAPQAQRVRAALGLAMRAASAPPLHCRMDRAATIALLRPALAPLAHEELHAVYLDATGAFRGRERLAKGGLSAVCVYPRDVLAPVLEARASAFVLAHNHPSGSCEPSPEDVSLSQRIEQASAVLGLRFLDHLVFSREGVASAMPAGARWPQVGPCRSL